MTDPAEPGPGDRSAPDARRLAESRPELVERIRAEILGADEARITFARFMELALYDPAAGYYVSRRDRPTRSGDFLTAPETHPLFGWTLARQVDECRERLEGPTPFVVREYGAGSGVLAQAMLEAARAGDNGLLGASFEPVESSEAARSAIESRLTVAGFGAQLGAASLDPFMGVVIANEFLDALPVHRVVQRRGELEELYVGWADGWFQDVPGQPSRPELGERFRTEGIELAEGQQAEVCLAVEGWLAQVSFDLLAGYVIVIDYGHPAEELYGPRRPHGSLLGYRRHQVSDEPYAAVGEQDLTAHVDLSHLRRAAAQVGLEHLGSTTQAEFLTGLGLGELLDRLGRDPDTDPQAYADARAGVLRFLDPRATGGFAVDIFGREVPAGPPLRGLSFRVERG